MPLSGPASTWVGCVKRTCVRYKITDAGLVMAASDIWLALRGFGDNVGELAPSVNYDDAG